MKELKNNKAYADIALEINLSVTYVNVHDEPETVEDIEAMDFLEKIGLDAIVMSRIWGDIAEGSYWGMFDYEYEQSHWVSIEWDIDGNEFTVLFNDGDDYRELSCSELSAEFFDIFGYRFERVANNSEKCCNLCFYFEEEINLENYPNILWEIEKQ